MLDYKVYSVFRMRNDGTECFEGRFTDLTVANDYSRKALYTDCDSVQIRDHAGRPIVDFWHDSQFGLRFRFR